MQKRLEAAYNDKLDGVITTQEWREKAEKWKTEQDRILEEISRHHKANKVYYEEGIKILELAQGVYNLWVKQNSFEKRKLLDFVVSNVQVNNVSLYPLYRKPFDLIAQAVKTGGWLPGLDSNQE